MMSRISLGMRRKGDCSVDMVGIVDVQQDSLRFWMIRMWYRGGGNVLILLRGDLVYRPSYTVLFNTKMA
jgi:hypothetical protein